MLQFCRIECDTFCVLQLVHLEVHNRYATLEAYASAVHLGQSLEKHNYLVTLT